jgi:hypothetical protein
MWQFQLPANTLPIPDPHDYNQARPVVEDIDGDGEKELLYPFRNLDHGEIPDTVYCFSASGRLRWVRQIGKEVRTHSGQIYPPHYSLNWIGVLHRPTPTGGRIVIGGHRGGTSLFAVELLTKDGKVVGEYYHPGWLWAMTVADLDHDGFDEVILGGVNNAYGALNGFEHPMTLVVLDSRYVAGQGPAPAEDARHFVGLSSGHERAVLFFREFGQVAEDDPSQYCTFRWLGYVGGHIQANATKLSSQMVVDYQFDSHLNLEFAMPSPALARLLTATLRRELTPAERTQFFLKELGNIKVAKNDLAGSAGIKN